MMIWVGVLGIVGRLLASWMSDTVGPRYSGFLIGMGGAISMAPIEEINRTLDTPAGVALDTVRVPAQ